MVRDYDLRAAKPDDANAVEALLHASYPRLMGPAYQKALLIPALKLMTRANPALLASGTYYLAESHSGLVVGCGGWTPARPGTNAVEPGLGHIRHFATHPDWTRRGIGRAIYLLCETAARSSGVKSFECYSSLNAESFYSALGFKSIRTIAIDLAPGVGLPAILMRRKL